VAKGPQRSCLFLHTRSRDWCRNASQRLREIGLQVTHVLTETFVLCVDGPLQVVRGDHEGKRAPREAIALGTDVMLHTADDPHFLMLMTRQTPTRLVRM
jgi:hypothetical protein